MTQVADRPLTRWGVLEAHADEVIAALVAGETWASQMAKYDVKKQSFAAFVKRHRQEIDALRARAAERVQDVVLTTKEGRIRELAWLYGGMKSELEERGFMWEEPHGKDREVLKMPTGAISEMRAALDDIARELGERSPKDTSTMGPGVIYRERIIEREMRLEPLG